ncbi:MAG: DEAD/DEAH box helicase [Gammaproteobacteria bacterium]|nr:DEAD/DEAH box helicase [Gammaproteobacteria bacterium]
MVKAGVESRARAIADGLYPHQVEGVAFLLGRRRAILADDMGLGKTRQSVIALTVAEPVGPYLVVCPASVKHNWAREIHLALTDAAVHVVGPAPLPPAGFAGWTIINYDLLKRHVDGLLAVPYTGLVFDEGHYIKNHRSQRSRLSRRLVTEGAAYVERDAEPAVHVLTGTPLTNRPRDLFPLLQLVGHSLGQSFLAFAKRYCDGHKNDYGYWMTNGVSNAAELSVQLQGIMLRRSKDETLDLPPKQRTWIDVDVDEEVRERLNEAVAGFMQEERNARGGRLGIAMMSGARRRLAVAKVPVTLEYVQGAVEQGEKVILYSCFTHATRRFARALGDQAVTVTGEVPTAKRQALVDRFQNDDAIRVFIGQIHAAGVGINLTAGRLVVFNDLDWVPANHWQAEDRAHRIGQGGTVNVTYMVARGTLEEFVRTVLERKSQLIDDVVEGRALGDGMEGDVLSELRRLLAHLDDTLTGQALVDADPATVEATLRAASERYLAEHTAQMTAAAQRELKPVSDSAIRALAAVLTGPEQVVYSITSSSGRSAYRLEVEGADITCDCKGFAYRGMCRHARTLKDALATGKPVPPEYRRVA